MFFETFVVYDPKDVEIEPIVGLETLAKFPISKSKTFSSY
jgi:hypothetical protein